MTGYHNIGSRFPSTLSNLTLFRFNPSRIYCHIHICLVYRVVLEGFSRFFFNPFILEKLSFSWLIMPRKMLKDKKIKVIKEMMAKSCMLADKPRAGRNHWNGVEVLPEHVWGQIWPLRKENLRSLSGYRQTHGMHGNRPSKRWRRPNHGSVIYRDLIARLLQVEKKD